jgi:hypothetical protein
MNLICGLGCSPWLFYILYYQKIYKIPILVFVNGISYHMICNNKIIKYYDILCNLSFIIYIYLYNKCNNLSTITTIISFYTYYYNSNSNINKYKKDILHVIFTNWILMIPYHYSTLKNNFLLNNSECINEV